MVILGGQRWELQFSHTSHWGTTVGRGHNIMNCYELWMLRIMAQGIADRCGVKEKENGKKKSIQ